MCVCGCSGGVVFGEGIGGGGFRGRGGGFRRLGSRGRGKILEMRGRCYDGVNRKLCNPQRSVDSALFRSATSRDVGGYSSARCLPLTTCTTEDRSREKQACEYFLP